MPSFGSSFGEQGAKFVGQASVQTSSEQGSVVRFAVLSLVIEEGPGTVTGIGTRLPLRYPGLISSDDRHARPVLRRLVTEGLVEAIPTAQLPALERRAAEARRARELFRATPAGVSAWRQALVSTIDPGRLDVELLVRLRSVRADDTVTFAAILDQFEAAATAAARAVPLGDEDETLAEALDRDYRRAEQAKNLKFLRAARERIEEAAARARDTR